MLFFFKKRPGSSVGGCRVEVARDVRQELEFNMLNLAHNLTGIWNIAAEYDIFFLKDGFE